MMNWISALAAQDQSFESLMAQRDLTKQQALLNDVARTKAAQEESAARSAEDKRQFDIRQSELKAEKERDRKDREEVQKRLRYNTVHGNLKPGDKMRNGPDLDLMREFGTGDQFTADPNDPDAWVYQKHAFEQAELKHKQEEERRKAAEARAAEDQKIQKERLEMERKREERAEKEAQRRQQAFERKQKDLDNKMSKLPPHLAQQANREMASWQKVNTQGFMESDDEYMARQHTAFDGILRTIEEKAVSTGAMAPRVPPATGRGGAGGSTPPAAAPPTFNSIEDIRKAFPGAKITPIGGGQ